MAAVIPDYEIFGIVAGIIALGFGGELFFKRTGIPSFLFLIFVGVLLGPITGILPGQALIPVLGTIADLTLIMVVFYSGMDTDLRAVVSGSGRVLIQVTLYVIPSTIIIGVLTSVFLHWEIVQALIFGSMIGGETTAAVVIPLSRSLNLKQKTTTFITVESVLNTIFSIVLFTAFVETYQTGSPNLLAALGIIASRFSVGIVMGGLMSLLWLVLLNYFKSHRYTYVFTLGLVFATYSISTALGGSGILSDLIFGIILGGYKTLNSSIFKSKPIDIDPLENQLGIFQGEISFLLETLFFVFLGLIFSINPAQIASNFEIGLLLLAILLAIRAFATSASTRNSDLQQDWGKVVLLCAQGLTPATLAIVAVNDGLPLAPIFLNLVTYVIILTNIVTMVGSIWITRMTRRGLFTEGGGQLSPVSEDHPPT